MAKFELSIYGQNDEVLKKYETDHVRWGVFLEAIKLQEAIKDKSAIEQLAACSGIVKSIFIGMTDEELEQADGGDVINTFKQLTAAAQGKKKKKNG